MKTKATIIDPDVITTYQDLIQLTFEHIFGTIMDV